MRETFWWPDLLPATELLLVAWLWRWVVKLRLHRRGQPCPPFRAERMSTVLGHPPVGSDDLPREQDGGPGAARTG